MHTYLHNSDGSNMIHSKRSRRFGARVRKLSFFISSVLTVVYMMMVKVKMTVVVEVMIRGQGIQFCEKQFWELSLGKEV